MPILAAAVVATAVAATSYLLPLIITCVGAALATIIAFIAGLNISKKRSPEEKIFELKKQQYSRDKKTKDDAEQVVQKTEQQINAILAQTIGQQQQWDKTMVALNHSLSETNTATESLERVTEQILASTDQGQINLAALAQELEIQKMALATVNGALKKAEQALVEKEARLSATLEHLTDSEKQFQADAHTNLKTIVELRQMLESRLHDLGELHQQNQLLSQKIHAQETIIQQLTTALEHSMQQQAAQHKDMQKLSGDNQHLASMVENLTSTMEGLRASSAPKTPADGSKIRLFK